MVWRKKVEVVPKHELIETSGMDLAGFLAF